MSEEIRGIINRDLTTWGKEVWTAFKEVGDGEIIKMIWENKEVNEI